MAERGSADTHEVESIVLIDFCGLIVLPDLEVQAYFTRSRRGVACPPSFSGGRCLRACPPPRPPLALAPDGSRQDHQARKSARRPTPGMDHARGSPEFPLPEQSQGGQRAASFPGQQPHPHPTTRTRWVYIPIAAVLGNPSAVGRLTRVGPARPIHIRGGR